MFQEKRDQKVSKQELAQHNMLGAVEEDDQGEKMMATTADNVTSNMSKAKDTHHRSNFFRRTALRRQGSSGIVVISK